MEWCGKLVTQKGFSCSKMFFTKTFRVHEPNQYQENVQALYVVYWLSTTISKLSELKLLYFRNLKGNKIIHLKRQNKLIKWTAYLEEKWSEFLTTLANFAERNSS